jgi:hypothetical protein
VEGCGVVTTLALGVGDGAGRGSGPPVSVALEFVPVKERWDGVRSFLAVSIQVGTEGFVG